MEPAAMVTAVAKVAASLCLVAACSLGLCLYRVLWLVPERARRELRRQGIAGPLPSFPYGNLADMRQAADAAARPTTSRGGAGGIVHDYRPAVFPFYEKWRQEYAAPVWLLACTGKKQTYGTKIDQRQRARRAAAAHA